MGLKEKIEAKKEAFQRDTPIEKQNIMRRALKELIESGAVERAANEGDKAPDFTLINAEGQSVTLSTSLLRRPAVLGFYRGRW